MRVIRRIIATAVLACLAAQPAFAAEGGNQYPHGAENWLAGALPPPGTYWLNYFGNYSGKLKNETGDTVRLPDGSNPSIDCWFNAVLLAYVSDKKILGGTWAAHMIVPVVHQTMDVGGSESVAGLGDISFAPFNVTWHGKQLHGWVGMDIYVPSGPYDSRNDRKSIGSNYMSYEPLAAITWLPPSGWEASARAMFNMTGENEATGYKSGHTFHADYLIGKHVGRWGVGVSGYYVQQVTDDEVDGEVVGRLDGFWDEGRRGRAFSAGPTVTYTAGKYLVSFEWHHEMAVKNRFSGDKFWFKATLPL